MPGKIYGRILTERQMQVTDKKVIDEQEGFRRVKSCIDQISANRMLGKDGKFACSLYGPRGSK